MKRRSEKLATGLGSSVINVVAGRNNIVAGACAKRVHGPCDQYHFKHRFDSADDRPLTYRSPTRNKHARTPLTTSFPSDRFSTHAARLHFWCGCTGALWPGTLVYGRYRRQTDSVIAVRVLQHKNSVISTGYVFSCASATTRPTFTPWRLLPMNGQFYPHPPTR
ncbi:hypothetical protein E4U56_000692 [Claviceps arundinis]|uniref:Uncharacterized protein n=1 Tax=Claviceps arundinis TaxID=1623583 RepID=A0A9P7MTY8_9HYPO|nr:hypothetical protein E4U56_000692 [Claviceps arundinis]